MPVVKEPEPVKPRAVLKRSRPVLNPVVESAGKRREVLLPGAEVRCVIARAAQLAAVFGPVFEQRVQRGDGGQNFTFLQPGDRFNPYYEMMYGQFVKKHSERRLQQLEEGLVEMRILVSSGGVREGVSGGGGEEGGSGQDWQPWMRGHGGDVVERLELAVEGLEAMLVVTRGEMEVGGQQCGSPCSGCILAGIPPWRAGRCWSCWSAVAGARHDHREDAECVESRNDEAAGSRAKV